jgi:hypothetical protein
MTRQSQSGGLILARGAATRGTAREVAAPPIETRAAR